MNDGSFAASWVEVGAEEAYRSAKKSGTFGIRFMFDVQLQTKHSLGSIILFHAIKNVPFFCLMVIFNVIGLFASNETISW